MQVGLFLFSLVKIKVLSQKFLKLIKVQDGISVCRLDFFKKSIRICCMIIWYCRVRGLPQLLLGGLNLLRGGNFKIWLQRFSYQPIRSFWCKNGNPTSLGSWIPSGPALESIRGPDPLEKTWLRAAGLSQIMMKNGAGFNPLEGSMSTKFPFLLLLIGKSNFQSKILSLDGAYL